jgi:hypothetical protein
MKLISLTSLEWLQTSLCTGKGTRGLILRFCTRLGRSTKIHELFKHTMCTKLTFSHDLLRASTANVLTKLSHLSVESPCAKR